LVLASAAFAAASCQEGGHFTVLGYTSRPNYDLTIHTVRVPIFQNLTFRRGLEFQLTEAVIREIELKTPYKVVSANCDADTELTGKIFSYNKAVINRNQLNEVREAETTLAVEVTWKNLRTGEIISRPPPRPDGPLPIIPAPPPPNLLPGNTLNPVVPALPGAGLSIPGQPVPDSALPPGTPPPPGAPPRPPPVLVQSIADFIPELGQSLATAYQDNVNRLAVQIVSMMEKPW
jgi:hypothetical protein